MRYAARRVRMLVGCWGRMVETRGTLNMVLIVRDHDRCRHNPGGIRVKGYGHIVDTNGETYYADHIVVSPAKTNPCRLP